MTQPACIISFAGFTLNKSPLCKRLESIPEGDGTMLDNTVIVYLSDGAERTIAAPGNGRSS